MKTIDSAVGRQGLNAEKDQRTVQELLNRIPASDGGPGQRLAAPIRQGVASAALQAAIERFQAKNVDPQFRDGRVDPQGQTLRLLNVLAGEVPAGKAHPGYDPKLGGVIDIDRPPLASVDVRGGLVPLKQPTTLGCWATSATMMWKLRNPGQISDVLPAREQVTTYLDTKTRNRFWRELFDRNEGLNALLFADFFGRELGMRPVDSPILSTGLAGGAGFWVPRLAATRKPHIFNASRLGWFTGSAHTALVVGASLAEQTPNQFAPIWVPGLGTITILDPAFGTFRTISGADLDFLLGPPGAGTPNTPPPAVANRLRCFYWP